MAGKIVGRPAKPAKADDDPLIGLLIGVVKRAQADLRLPPHRAGIGGGANPTARERAEAAQFLDEMYLSALRRTP